MLFWTLLASGQITMHRIDDRPLRTAHRSTLSSPPDRDHHAVPDPRRANFHQLAVMDWASWAVQACGCRTRWT
jgi:hypothetical protein